MFNSNTGNDTIVESLQIWGEVSLNSSVYNCVFNKTVFQKHLRWGGKLFIHKLIFMEKKKFLGMT